MVWGRGMHRFLFISYEIGYLLLKDADKEVYFFYIKLASYYHTFVRLGKNHVRWMSRYIFARQQEEVHH